MSKEVHAKTGEAKETLRDTRRVITTRKFRLGSAPYLIARPLVYGLEASSTVEIVRAAPADLRRLLISGEVDAAVLPSIDLPSFGPRLSVLPAGCLAASGPTLMAKIFSQVKPDKLTLMWVDRQSHATAALVQVLWQSLYHRKLSVIPYDATRDKLPSDAQSAMLIGDHVVGNPPMGYNWHIDPVAMWHEMTGLPFVFGVWATLREDARAALYSQLETARQGGQEHLEQIAEQCAAAYDWPVDLALRCLSKELQYEFTDAHREGLEEFIEMATECGLLESPAPLNYYKP